MAEERFYSLGRYLKETFGERVHKIRVNVGEPVGSFADSDTVILSVGGTLDGGTHDTDLPPVAEQLAESKERVRKRFKTGKFIVYLHSGIGSCVSLETLTKTVDEILYDNEVIGITFVTRPECLSDAFIGYLNRTAGYTHTWLEIGVMTMHDETIRRIGMKHTSEDVMAVLQELMGTQLRVAPHLVLGLPGETPDQMRESIKEISRYAIHGINIHNFYVLSGTPFEEQYRKGELSLLGQEEYVNLVCDVIEMLPPGVVLHRIVGEADSERLVAPEWTADRKGTLSMISAEMEKRGSNQGKQLTEIPSGFPV